MNPGFTPLESAVMDKLVAGSHPVLVALRQQYEASSVANRRMTGVGFFVDLAVPADTPTIAGLEKLHLADVIAELDGLKHGAGFVLHIFDGRLHQLEGYSYDEPWPNNVGKFTVSYLHGEERPTEIAEINEALQLTVRNGPLGKLLERAKGGTATRFDAAAAAALLPDLTDSEDRYDALFVLGKGGDETYAGVVEPFMDERDDAFLARLAVQILCSWWGLGARYRDRLLGFVAGEPWDLESGGFVQSVAVSASGEVIRQTQDGPLLRALLEAFDSEESGDDLRREGYAALLRASGKEPRDIPGTGSDDWRRPDLGILEMLRQRAKL